MARGNNDPLSVSAFGEQAQIRFFDEVDLHGEAIFTLFSICAKGESCHCALKNPFG
jgi:hypothetical protein